MKDITLHLGTNIGFRAINLELARLMISNDIGDIKQASAIYETAAWGVEDQQAFLNQALSCQTILEPQALLAAIHEVEARMGRVRTDRWGPRIIDIDIIFYGDEIIENHNLKIPHPQLTNRNFVLQPLLDICALKMHPSLHKTVKELAEECTDTGKVALYEN